MTKKAKIYYFSLTDEMPRLHKLFWFRFVDLRRIPFVQIIPDDKGNWLNLTDNDFESLMPVCDKEVKLGKKQQAIFKLYSLGVVTARDEWAYDFDKTHLNKKLAFFINTYNAEVKRWKESDHTLESNDFVDRTIKWTSELEAHLTKEHPLAYDENCIVSSLYRPFIKSYLYFDKIIVHRLYQNESIFGLQRSNSVISFSGQSSAKPFQCLVSNQLLAFDFLEKTQCLPLYLYDKSGTRHENITDWALKAFQAQYAEISELSKTDIFHYVYAVLHNPAYREKYAQNLKREFPRLPFYADFPQWVQWGKQLMDLHLNYENIAAYPLQRQEIASLANPKAKLKADKTAGSIQLDDNTLLSNIPATAWEYQLGNRSALEWILDQHKEKKPKDPTIAERFNNYRFAEYKEQVIDLLQRVCTVSVETVQIIEAMKTEY